MLSENVSFRDRVSLESENRATLHNKVAEKKTGASIEWSAGKERTDIPYSLRFIIYVSLLSSTFFLNVDGGVFPAAVL